MAAWIRNRLPSLETDFIDRTRDDSIARENHRLLIGDTNVPFP